MADVTVIPLDRLAAEDACGEALDWLRAEYPEGVPVTEAVVDRLIAERCEWAQWALCLVSSAAWAEYDRATAPAWAEYDRARAAARAEYDRATDAARAEYDRATAAAWAEYDRATAAALRTALLTLATPARRRWRT